MSDKTMTVELTEQDSAIIILSLELRGMYFVPHNLPDRRRLTELKKELQKRHSEVFAHTPTPEEEVKREKDHRN